MDCYKCEEPIKKEELAVCVTCAGPRSMNSLKGEIFKWAEKEPEYRSYGNANKSEMTIIHNYIKELRTKLGESNDR